MWRIVQKLHGNTLSKPNKKYKSWPAIIAEKNNFIHTFDPLGVRECFSGELSCDVLTDDGAVLFKGTLRAPFNGFGGSTLFDFFIITGFNLTLLFTIVLFVLLFIILFGPKFKRPTFGNFAIIVLFNNSSSNVCGISG